MPDAGIADPSDLRGKTIATAGIPYQDAFIGRILRDARISEDEVEQVSVGLGLEQAVLSGKADAMLGGFRNIEGVSLEERGENPRVVPVDELGIPTYDELVLSRAPSRSKRTRSRSACSSLRSSAARRTPSRIPTPRPTRSSKPATAWTRS